MRRLIHRLTRRRAERVCAREQQHTEEARLLFRVVREKRAEHAANGRVLFQEINKAERDEAPMRQLQGSLGDPVNIRGGEAVSNTAASASDSARARFRISLRRPSPRMPFAVRMTAPRFGFVPSSHVPRLRVTKGRLSIAGALAVALAVVTAGIAYWTSNGSGTAGASTTELSEPSSVLATGVAPNVVVEWDASLITGPDVPAQSYDVRRYDASDDSDLGPACGGSTPSSAGDPDSSGHFECTDSPPSAGSFKYRITANFATWTADSGFTNTVSVGPLDHFDVDAPSDSTAGDAFDVTVTAQDVFDNTLIGYSGTLQFASSDSQAELPSDYTFSGGDAGVRTFVNGVTLKTAGDQTIDVNDSSDPATGTATVSVSAAAIDHFNVVVPNPQTAGLASDTTVSAKDPYNNTVTSYSGSQSLAFSGPGTSPAPSSTAPLYPGSVTFAAGVGTASFTLFKAESTTLTATQGLISGTSGSFTVDPGSADNFLVPTPATQTAGAAFNETLTARDQWSNVATGYAGSKVVAFSGPGTSPAPSSTAPLYPGSVTFAAGVGTASFTLFKAESTTLTATQGSISGTSGSFTVDPGSADNFLVPTPATQTAGAAFNETLTARDQWSNVATGYAGSKVVAFSGPGTSPAPSSTAPLYPGSVTFAAGVGTASFTLFKAESTTLTATQGLISGTSGSFTVDPGSADNFLVPTPATQTAGAAFNETLTARDQWSNVATGYAGSKVVAFSGPGTSPAPSSTAPLYPGSVTFAAGVGTASFTLFKAESTTLTATQGLISGTSGSFTVDPDTLDSFTVAPGSGTRIAGDAFTVTVTAFDAYSNQKTNYAGTIAFTSNDPQATLPGNYTFVGGDNGQHAFTNAVTLKTAGTGKTVTVTDSGKTGTATYTVDPGAPASITKTAGDNQSTGSTTAFATNLKVTVADAFGNHVLAGVSVTFTAPASGPSGSFAAAGCTGQPPTRVCVVSTAADGTATATTLTANTNAGTYAVSATATGGSTPSVNFSLTNTHTTLNFTTVGTHTLTIPAGVTTVDFTLFGAGGGASGAAAGGHATSVAGTITLASNPSGVTLTVIVGGGGSGAATATGGTGFGNGGTGGTASNGTRGGGGGGGTGIRTSGLVTVVVAAGGGGGGGIRGSATGGSGGNGGVPSVSSTANTGGPGGTGTGGQAGGAGGSTSAAGTATNGGASANGGNSQTGGGGGGGGYAFGGGGGGSTGNGQGAGGGGGGSSYTAGGGGVSVTITSVGLGSGTQGGGGTGNGVGGNGSASFTGAGISGT